MIITPIQTHTVTLSQCSLFELIDRYVTKLPEKSILVLTSKIVSLCEGSAVPIEDTDREALIVDEADMYLPPSYSMYGHHFSIKHGTIVGSAGIDVSNGDGNYVLWPADLQKTA